MSQPSHCRGLIAFAKFEAANGVRQPGPILDVVGREARQLASEFCSVARVDEAGRGRRQVVQGRTSLPPGVKKCQIPVELVPQVTTRGRGIAGFAFGTFGASQRTGVLSVGTGRDCFRSC